jgi:hypothetical protein
MRAAIETTSTYSSLPTTPLSSTIVSPAAIPVTEVSSTAVAAAATLVFTVVETSFTSPVLNHTSRPAESLVSSATPPFR